MNGDQGLDPTDSATSEARAGWQAMLMTSRKSLSHPAIRIRRFYFLLLPANKKWPA